MSSEPRGILHLVPNTLGNGDPEAAIAAAVLDRTRSLEYFIAESEKAARAFLKRIGVTRPLQSLRIERLDHNTPVGKLPELLAPVVAGRDAGLLSEAGLPAVADPGANLVRLAHELGIRVVPLPGPSSISLALAASGLNGQRFAFQGYLPVEEKQRVAALKDLERRSRQLGETQIVIETPYRNDRTLATMLRILAPNTLVCIAAELTLDGEMVRTRTVSGWRGNSPQLRERPTVFLILAG
jgi:16S rRNA (cytidine1402-2'-O)-methyltransferase